jgi:hypothetical protein
MQQKAFFKATKNIHIKIKFLINLLVRRRRAAVCGEK